MKVGIAWGKQWRRVGGGGDRQTAWEKKSGGKFLWRCKCSIFGLGWWFTWVSTCVKSHSCVQLKCMSFIICNILQKVDFFKKVKTCAHIKEEKTKQNT